MADLFLAESAAWTGAKAGQGTGYRKLYLVPDGARNPEGTAQIYVRNDHVWEATPDLDPWTDGWQKAETQTPVNLLVFCHGKQGDESNFDESRTKEMRAMMMDRGDFIVVQSRAGGPGYGNQGALNDYKAAIDACTRWFNVKHTFTMGASMGGVPAVLLKVKEALPIVGIISISGLLDLLNQYQTVEPGALKTAYGLGSGATEADFIAASTGHDPMTYPASAYAGTFLRAYGSEGDTSVDEAANGLAWITQADAEAEEAEFVLATGIHLSSDHYRPSEVSQFLDRAIAYADTVEPPPPPPPGVFDLFWNGPDGPVKVQVQRQAANGIRENVTFTGPED